MAAISAGKAVKIGGDLQLAAAARAGQGHDIGYEMLLAG
jgi:hypothetical protein